MNAGLFVLAAVITCLCIFSDLIVVGYTPEPWYYGDVQQCLARGGTPHIPPGGSLYCLDGGVLIHMPNSVNPNGRRL